MELSVSHQAYVFVCMILCGALSGIIFDIFRSFRRCVRSKSYVIAAQDLLFWIIELFVVYVTAFNVNSAQMRGYEAIALILGTVLYFVTVSSYVMHFLCYVFSFLKKVCIALLKPLNKIISLIILPFKSFYSFCGKYVLNIKNNTKSFIKSKSKIVKTAIIGKFHKI